MAVFFPKSQHPISVCKHANGKDLTITEQTDTLQLRYPIERYGFKHNVRVGAFIGKHYASDSTDINTIDKMGNIRNDIYLNVSSVAGSYSEAMAIIQPWFKSLTGRKPSAVSFAGGNESLAANTINDFLGGRNSQIGESQYGIYNDEYLGTPAEAFTRANYANLASTTRWSDDMPAPLTWIEVAEALEDVVDSEGWFRNFTHWHALNPGRVQMQEEFYETLNNTLSLLGKSAHFCSFGEALEYLTYRQLITRVTCYDSVNGNVRIAIEVKETYLNECFNTPISVRIDLSESVHAGKDFTSLNCDIIKLSATEFIVNVPFRTDAKTHKIMLVELVPTTTPTYKDFIKPTITTSIVGDTLTITTDKPTYATLFNKATADGEHQFRLFGRSMALKTTHVFTGLSSSGQDYSVGVIDKYGNQNLKDL